MNPGGDRGILLSIGLSEITVNREVNTKINLNDDIIIDDPRIIAMPLSSFLLLR